MSDTLHSPRAPINAASAHVPDTRFDRRAAPRPRLAEIRAGASRSLISPRVLSGLVRLAEFAIVAVVGYVVHLAYVADNWQLNVMYGAACLVAGLTTVVLFQMIGLYNTPAFTHFPRSFARIAVAWSMMFAALTMIAFLVKIGQDFSRVWLASWFFLGFCAIAVIRLFLVRAVRGWARTGRLDRRAVIVGGGAAGVDLIQALEASPETDIRICGVFDDRGDGRVSTTVGGYPLLGNVDELVEFGRNSRVDLLIVTLPIAAENRLLQLFKKLWVLPVDIRLSAHSNTLRFRPRTYSYIGNVPFIDVLDRPIADWDYVAKWIFDKAVALAMIVLLSPLFLLIAAAVKLDSNGPVLFRQKRYGFNNERIGVYKFRSMYVDQTDHRASKLVTKDDPRVTRVGRFIRKTSLDELPQLFNVLKGELSLVGPRPHAEQAKAADELYHDVVDGYFARHRVKPGITGWAQVNGWRGETDTSEKIHRRVEHDLYYIENWSVALDLLILLKTPFALLKSENAY